jgi:4,5-dihydroxyphthalate decarboxylase
LSTPQIVIRGADYEHTVAVPGTYAGMQFGYETMRPQEIFIPMLESRCFEVCEFSLANYLTLRAAGETWISAIPVFPMRAFRHGLAVTLEESPLESLGALAGKRIGIDDYSMTAAVWFRGLLQEEYGVDHRSITWVTRPKQRFPIPPGARVERMEGALEDLLCAGRIDAMLGFGLKDASLPKAQRRLRTVLRDVVGEEQAYFAKTSIYPINHVVAIRSDVLEKYPACSAAVYAAFAQAKEKAYARQLGATLVPWSKLLWTSTFDFFGGDPLPYGLTDVNRLVVGRLAAYLKEQSFIAAELDLDSLFVTPA